jgi:ParB-like chromosome segregation protein Spo0J
LDNVIEALLPLKVPLDSVKPDPRNPRHHPARNLKALMDSLDTYGQRKPIVVNADTMTIEAGNGMWEAAQTLGWDEIAVAFVRDDKAVATAYGIMDNQSALLTDWDLPTLKDLLEELDTSESMPEVEGLPILGGESTQLT